MRTVIGPVANQNCKDFNLRRPIIDKNCPYAEVFSCNSSYRRLCIYYQILVFIMQSFYLTIPGSNQKIALVDIHKESTLEIIHQNFLAYLAKTNKEVSLELVLSYQEKVYNAELTLALAPILEEYLTLIFKLEDNQKIKSGEADLIQDIRKKFIHKKCYKKTFKGSLEDLNLNNQLKPYLTNFNQVQFAQLIQDAIINEEINLLNDIEQYCLWACHNIDGKLKHKDDILFKIPEKIDSNNLLKINAHNHKFKSTYNKNRVGFDHHDTDLNYNHAFTETTYCLYCHNRGKDSCSKGLYDKEANLQKSATGAKLKGCPLDQKISEMNLLFKDHRSIAAIAVAMIDNPLLLLTGHRICNDCMKACIFQNQDPVNIPLIETGILDDVLNLAYGFEIYYLLTLWNPLNYKRPLPKSAANKKVLICGSGPAGISLAYNLLMDGHIAVIIDGLKTEPVKDEIFDKFGNIILYPDCKTSLFQNLSERISEGFGGVSEYGITARWNKNYLKLARIILERNSHFHLYGGIRFGSQITKETAFELGFDHIAFCMGAGSPNIINLGNNLSPGVRKASDFLMTLQLLGSFDIKSLVNLQIRMPIVVIGGGLTAIDTATESLAYYPIQILKFKEQLDSLMMGDHRASPLQNGINHNSVGAGSSRPETPDIFDQGRDNLAPTHKSKHNSYKNITSELNQAELEIFEEFLAHSKLFEAEIEQAKSQNRAINFLPILNDLGGSTIIYRKALRESPAYRLNHEEIIKALEEGIIIAEYTTPKSVIKDEYGKAKEIEVIQSKQRQIMPAKTILIAAGTKANIIIANEDSDFAVENNYLKLANNKSDIADRFFCYQDNQNHAISVFGDMHPYYAGSVVKALASSKNGYSQISQILSLRPDNKISNLEFKTTLDNNLIAKVVKITRLTNNIIEVIVKAKLASEAFAPGQFYRLQNYSKSAKIINGKRLDIEPLALTGSNVNPDTGHISLIALEMGGSSNLLKYLKEDEEVILMGPTGTPTEILKDKTILLAGGGLGNAVLFSIGKALKQNGCKILYFAGYKKATDRYKIQEIENVADSVIWCCDEANDFKVNRESDFKFTGNIIEAMVAYSEARLGKIKIKLSDVDRIIAIGSDKMMHAIGKARHGALQRYLNPQHDAIASINSPMNCMMKEICGQCLQKHIDPVTKKEYFVFSCFNQDQDLDNVDFENLQQRLSQNSLQEKMTKLWIKESGK